MIGIHHDNIYCNAVLQGRIAIMDINNMSKADMIKRLETRKEKVKKQNEKAKEKWDKITVSFSKNDDIKERIKKLGYSNNRFITDAVLEKLQRMETEQVEEIPDKAPFM